MVLWKAALAGFVAMTISDIIGAAVVIFESRYQWFPAGVTDALGYLVGLLCSVLAIDSILEHGFRNKRSLVLVGAITVANFIGTALGVALVHYLS